MRVFFAILENEILFYPFMSLFLWIFKWLSLNQSPHWNKESFYYGKTIVLRKTDFCPSLIFFWLSESTSIASSNSKLVKCWFVVIESFLLAILMPFSTVSTGFVKKSATLTFQPCWRWTKQFYLASQVLQP